ncbi:retinol dehydrogenase 11-like isoform X3 [Oratosquilla oratoria]|uniref:retinol dehydrogenase 11-like isoform X3 n=1 Tax=Oratosquilla oratoria TaxID=337810 RepID=UPI003F75EA53
MLRQKTWKRTDKQYIIRKYKATKVLKKKKRRLIGSKTDAHCWCCSRVYIDDIALLAETDKCLQKMMHSFLRGCAITVWQYILLYALSAWYIIKENFTQHKKPTGIECEDHHVAIITGAGRGIGLETAKQFLQSGMTVIFAGQSLEAMQKEIDGLRQEGITSAGIMFAQYGKTEEGFEFHWSVNYLGHFLLTHLCLPLLINSGTSAAPSRVVNLSSCVHYTGSICFQDINSEQYYSPQAAYSQSKLAQIMFTLFLNAKLEELGHVIINAVHPGIVCTDLFQNVTWMQYLPILGRWFLKSPQQGSDTVVHVALSRSIVDGGKYFENCQATVPSSAAMDLHLQKKLWDLSCHQLGITNFGCIKD